MFAKASDLTIWLFFALFASSTVTELNSPQSTTGNSGNDYSLFTMLSNIAN
jgi:hypothetical protein